MLHLFHRSPKRGPQSPPVRGRTVLLSTIPLTLAALLVQGAVTARHRARPVASLTAAAKPAPVPHCDCAKSSSIKGKRIHLKKRDANGQPTVGPDSTYDVIVPDANLWTAVHVQAGAEEYFGTNVPLPSGADPGQGGWSATYGQISRDGTVYRAPNDVPDGSIDILDYTPPDGKSGVPIVQVIVYVDEAPEAVATLNAGSARQISPSGASVPATAVPVERQAVIGEADTEEITAPDTSGNCQQAEEVALEDNLLSAPPPVIGPLSNGDAEFDEPSTVSGTLAPAPDPNQMEAGYPIPCFTTDNSLQFGVRKKNPKTGKSRQMPVVKCKQAGPMLPPLPFPIDPKTKKPWDHYSCSPGGLWDEPSDPKSRFLQWGCKRYWSGEKTAGKINVQLSLAQTVDIKTIYNVQLNANINIAIDVKYQENYQVCHKYVDHYQCADNGKNWIYMGTTMYTKDGHGALYKPAWYAYLMGYPPNGDPSYGTPYQEEIHTQR